MEGPWAPRQSLGLTGGLSQVGQNLVKPWIFSELDVHRTNGMLPRAQICQDANRRAPQTPQMATPVRAPRVHKSQRQRGLSPPVATPIWASQNSQHQGGLPPEPRTPNTKVGLLVPPPMWAPQGPQLPNPMWKFVARSSRWTFGRGQPRQPEPSPQLPMPPAWAPKARKSPGQWASQGPQMAMPACPQLPERPQLPTSWAPELPTKGHKWQLQFGLPSGHNSPHQCGLTRAHTWQSQCTSICAAPETATATPMWAFVNPQLPTPTWSPRAHTRQRHHN